MIDIEALKVGDVVQLVSGSPYMTVRGFKPLGASDRHGRQPARTHVCVVLWGDRLGFVEKEFRPEELRFPRPRETPPTAEAGAAGEGSHADPA